jgi:triacylglycerol lipase
MGADADTQARWPLELAQLYASPVFYGRGVPRGDGRSVILIPGLFAGDASLALLHAWLRRIGYRPQTAHIVVNADCSQRALDRLDRRLVAVAARTDAPIALIGHSRGGHLARALAHRRPNAVDTVITLGTALTDPYDVSRPVQALITGLRAYHSAVTDRHERRGCLTATCSCSFAGHLQGPLEPHVALTSIYSRNDGVVPAHTSRPADATAVEVTGSHVGLAWNPRVYAAIARALHEGGTAAGNFVDAPGKAVL